MGSINANLSETEYATLEEIRAGESVVVSATEYGLFEKVRDFVNEKKVKLNELDLPLLAQIRNGEKMVLPAQGHAPTQDTLDTIAASWKELSGNDLYFRFGAEPVIANKITPDEIDLICEIRNGDSIVIRNGDLTFGAGELQPVGDDPFTQYQVDQTAWSLKTFGPGPRTLGIIEHITKELGEIKDRPYDLSEWLDVVILGLDGFWRHGGNSRMALELLLRVQARNFARQWPDWRTMSEDQAIEHDRSKDQPNT